MVNMGELFANDRIGDIAMERVPMTDNELEQCALAEGDLLFARQSLVLEGAGKCSYVLEVPEPTTFESHLIRVRLDRNKADPLFYYYLFSSPYSGISTIVQQCAQAGIRGSELGNLEVIYPKPEAQRLRQRGGGRRAQVVGRGGWISAAHGEDRCLAARLRSSTATAATR
jgi:type I restriction enzyme S subunit